MNRHLGEALDNIINLNQILQRSFRDTGDKRTIALRKILVFFQRIPKSDMAVRLSLRNLHQNSQNDFSQIHCTCHNSVSCLNQSA